MVDHKPDGLEVDRNTYFTWTACWDTLDDLNDEKIARFKISIVLRDLASDYKPLLVEYHAAGDYKLGRYKRVVDDNDINALIDRSIKTLSQYAAEYPFNKPTPEVTSITSMALYSLSVIERTSSKKDLEEIVKRMTITGMPLIATRGNVESYLYISLANTLVKARGFGDLVTDTMKRIEKNLDAARILVE